MKANTGKYREVITLPKKAQTIKAYAEQNNITTSYVYKQMREKKNKFEVVIFQGVNFVIPA